MSAISKAMGKMMGEPIAVLDAKIKASPLSQLNGRTQNLTPDEIKAFSTFIRENMNEIRAVQALKEAEDVNQGNKYSRRLEGCPKTSQVIRFLVKNAQEEMRLEVGIKKLREEMTRLPHYQELNIGVASLASAIAGENLSLEKKIQILEEKQRKQIEGFLDTQENGDFVITSRTPGVQLHVAFVMLKDYISEHSETLENLEQLRKNHPLEYQKVVDEMPDGKALIDFLTGGSKETEPFSLFGEKELLLVKEKAREQFDASYDANPFDVQGQQRAFETYQNTIHRVNVCQYAIELTRNPNAVKSQEERLLEEYKKAREDFPENTQFVNSYFIKRGVSEANAPYLAFARAQFLADYNRVDEIVLDGVRILTPRGLENERRALEEKGASSPDQISESEKVAESSGSDKEKIDSPQHEEMKVSSKDWPSEEVFRMIVSAVKSSKRGSGEKGLSDLQIAELFLASTQAAEDKTQFFCMDQKIYTPIIAEGNVCSIKIIIDTRAETVTRESETKSAFPHPEAVDKEGLPLPVIKNAGTIRIRNVFYYRTGDYKISFIDYQNAQGRFLGNPVETTLDSGKYTSDAEG